MSETIHTSTFLEAKPKAIYDAWLDGEEHSAMTGGGATSDPRVGGKHTAWDGYVAGEHLELLPGRLIVQTWRTTEFPKNAPDSRLIVILEAEGGGTRLTLVHTDIPKGQGKQYEKGWSEHYFAPMRRYFAKKKKGAAKKRR